MYNLNNVVARRSWGFSELLRPFVLTTSFRIPITLQRKLPTNLIKIFNSYSTCGRYNLGRVVIIHSCTANSQKKSDQASTALPRSFALSMATPPRRPGRVSAMVPGATNLA